METQSRLRRMEKMNVTPLKYRSLLCFGVVMVLQSSAFAELIRVTNISEIMSESPLIAVITVTHIQPVSLKEEEASRRGQTYERSNVEATTLEFLKGSSEDTALTLQDVPCGSDNRFVASLAAGNDYVVFMRKENGLYKLTDNYNAIYPIKRDPVLPTEGDLRSRLQQIFLDSLSSEDKYVLAHALIGLAHVGGANNIQEIQALTESSDGAVRLAAYASLVHLGDFESALGLVTQMEKIQACPPSVMLKLQSLTSSALARMASPEYTPEILSFLEVAQSDQVVALLVSALRDTLSPDHVEALRPYMYHTNIYLAYDAYVAVSRAIDMNYSSVMAFQERRQELVDELRGHIDDRMMRK